MLATTLLLTACGPRAVLGVRKADSPPGRPAAPDPVNVAHAVEPHAVSAAHLGGGAIDGGVVISRLPAPHRARPVAALPPATPAAARALVGHRDPRDGVAFALDVAGALTAAAPPADVADGAALVQWAQAHGRWAPLTPGARPAEGLLVGGDLVVFDDVAPAALIAVVLGTDTRGVTDVLYVARGVVRRGYLDLGRPRVARDREGRAVNSFIRHGSDHPPPGTRYLAGELASGRVRIR